jgi:hypothetical protein
MNPVAPHRVNTDTIAFLLWILILVVAPISVTGYCHHQPVIDHNKMSTMRIGGASVLRRFSGTRAVPKSLRRFGPASAQQERTMHQFPRLSALNAPTATVSPTTLLTSKLSTSSGPVTPPSVGEAIILPTYANKPQLKCIRTTSGLVLALAIQKLFKDSLCAGIVCTDNGYGVCEL